LKTRLYRIPFSFALRLLRLVRALHVAFGEIGVGPIADSGNSSPVMVVCWGLCLRWSTHSAYPSFSSQISESFVTQLLASASVAKPGTSISGRSGNLMMTSHPGPAFIGRGSNL